MVIEPTATPLPGSGPGTALPTTIDKSEISEDYDMFLRLMTAQLKNQDPLQPVDGTEFVAQLAQFSGVEQQIKTNERLDSLLGALTRSAAETSLGFLGRTVETASGRVEVEAGAPAPFAFEVGKPANKAVAVVADAEGIEVRRFDVDASTLGRREAVWDGYDGIGNPASHDGVYTIRVEIYDDAGKKVIGELPVLTRAKVVEARIGADTGTLILSNGAEATLSDLRAIALTDLPS
jgi:flagellar basal-body rod modification protein FlgD